VVLVGFEHVYPWVQLDETAQGVQVQSVLLPWEQEALPVFGVTTAFV
jgi:hypothetical protein